MSGALSKARFEAALQSEFAVRAYGQPNAEPIPLRLAEVKTLPAPAGYEQFSALFVGPGMPIPAQGVYLFAHPAMGEVALFMVPLGPARDGSHYEVCISCALPA